MIGDRFFESEDIKLEFQMPVEQAMQNLGARVKAPAQMTQRKEESLIGSVTHDATYLYRSVPGSRNSFRQTFYGSFTGDGERSTLTGQITLNRVVKKFIVLWCVIVGLSAAFTVLTVLRNPAASWGSVLYLVGMLVVCMLFFRWMIGKGSGDRGWIKERIVGAVGGG